MKFESSEIESGHNEINGGEAAIAEMISTLSRVGPPSDFDVKVRSRIARAVSITHRRNLRQFRVLTYAIPLVVLVFFGAVYLLFGPRSVDVSAVPPPDSDTIRQNVPFDPQNLAEKSESTLDNDAVAAGPDPELTAGAAKKPVTLQGTKMRSSTEETSIGSQDRSLAPAEAPVFPKDLSPKISKSGMPGNGSTDQGVNVRDILKLFGIDSECSVNGCRIEDVSDKSVAMNSGLKPGDLIVSMDQVKISSNTSFKDAATVRQFVIFRGNRKMLIQLRSR